MELKNFPKIIDLNFFWSDHQLAYLIRLVVMGAFMAASAAFLGLAIQRPWYILLMLIAFTNSYISAALYLKNLYELPDLSLALEYLTACAFLPSMRPTIKVSNGKLVTEKGKINLIQRIGGPGVVYVESKNVVLFEKLTGYSQIVGEGEHDIHRYEFIREAMSLDEQHCLLDVVKAITVDGIRVRVNQIHVRYKLRERENLWTTSVGETMDGEAYRNAIKNLSDNRLVSEIGLLSLEATVKGIIAAAIQRYINKHTIDQIITPEDQNVDSRQALKAELDGIEVRGQMMSIGARLIGIQLGAFEFPDTPIDKFRLGKWKETKRGEIKVLQAEGDAYELSRQDAVRSQTQVEMIRGIITALEDLQIDDMRDLDALIQFRTAQILDMWSGLYKSNSEDDPSVSRYIKRRDNPAEED
jgi:hypothetical protein